MIAGWYDGSLNHDWVVSQSALLQDVWRYASTNTRTIDVHMAMLRQKLEDEPQHPKHLITVRGRGYMYTEAACRAAPQEAVRARRRHVLTNSEGALT